MSERTARTKKEIVNEILWNNNEVTIGGKSVFYKQWDAGVKTLPDIPDKEGKFMTFTAFKEKYKINTHSVLYQRRRRGARDPPLGRPSFEQTTYNIQVAKTPTF